MLTDRQQKPMRLTAEQAKRLARVCERLGKTEQAFMQSAVMRSVEEAEADMRERADRKQRKREERETRRPLDEPVGLGISMHREREIERDPEPTPAPTSQVVFNVATPAAPAPAQAPAGDRSVLIAELAAYVAGGPEYSRAERTEDAVRILRGSANTAAEREALAKQLDDAVAAKIKERPSPLSEVKRAMSIGFDKIREMFP